MRIQSGDVMKKYLWVFAVFIVVLVVVRALLTLQRPPDSVQPCQFIRDKYPIGVACNVVTECAGGGFTKDDIAQYAGKTFGYCCPRGYNLGSDKNVAVCNKNKPGQQ